MRALALSGGGARIHYHAGALQHLLAELRREYQIVIIPTAPVPIGGGLLFMPTEMVQPADVSVEALMSIYVSMGITAPQFLAVQAS